MNSNCTRTILFRAGTFYVYQIDRQPWINFFVGHATCPMDIGKHASLTTNRKRYKCNACNAVNSPKNAVILQDALELIKSGLDP